jgi:GGDEF domain-containing protein
VGSSATEALIRICHRRFRSFSEAAEAILSAIGDVIPGVVLLGQMEIDEQICRILDVQGDGLDGVSKGVVLPLAASRDGDDRGETPAPFSDSELDSEFLRTLGVEAWFAAPLEMSDGRIAGTLAALDSRPDAYRSEHIAILGIAARLLSYEWESVERRAELRRLRGRLSASAEIDSETCLLGRETFLHLLDREWTLAERGTVESMVVAFRIDSGVEPGAKAEATRRLALKTAAEILEGTVRTTDRAGRIGDVTLAAALIGCSSDQAPIFVERFRAALGRVCRDGNLHVEVSHGLQALGETSSAQEAVDRADIAAEVAMRHESAPQPAYEGVANE